MVQKWHSQTRPVTDRRKTAKVRHAHHARYQPMAERVKCDVCLKTYPPHEIGQSTETVICDDCLGLFLRSEIEHVKAVEGSQLGAAEEVVADEATRPLGFPAGAGSCTEGDGI